MAEQTPTPIAAKPAAPPSVTKESLVAKLTSLRTEAEKQAGSPFFNPFLWHKKNVAPLLAQLKEAKAVTPELVTAVNAIRVPSPEENKKAHLARHAEPETPAAEE